MFCMRCEAENKDGSRFCRKCGNLLESPPVAAQPQPEPSPLQQPQEAAVAAPQPAVPAAAPAPNAAAPQPAAPYQATGYVPTPVPEGPVGAAWRDIKSSPHWLKRLLTLCLIGCVPILNFATDGYCLRWARELSFGKRTPMPSSIFRKREIAVGFFAWLIVIALSAAFALVFLGGSLLITGLFGLLNAGVAVGIGLILALAAFVFALLFFQPVVDACVLRMSIMGYLEAGFNFKTVWECFRRSMGSLIGASVLPRLIVAVISGLVAVVFLLLIQLTIQAGISAVYSHSSSFLYGMGSGTTLGMGMPNFSGILGAIAGASYFVLFEVLLCYVAVAMLGVFQKLFTYRAVGHWVARTAPQWAQDSQEKLDDGEADGVSLDGSGSQPAPSPFTPAS